MSAMHPGLLFALANLVTSKERPVRHDDDSTAVLVRQLEYVQAEVFNIEYAIPKVLTLVPLDTTVPAGAVQFTYREWDIVGVAEIVTNYARDLPRVDVLVNEYPQKIITVGDAYGFTQKELRSAAFAGVQLDPMKAQAAKQAIDRKIDALVSLGNTATGLKGFVNHPNVPRLSLPTGSWASATPDQIIQDMLAMERAVIVNTMDIHHPDTLVLPLAHYAKIASTPRSSTSDTTILAYFLKNSQYIKNVESWYRLATAGLSGAPLAVCYEKSPMVVRAVVPVPFEQMPPEVRNLEWLTNCTADIGGCVWYRPLAAVYGDGLGALS